MTTPGDRPLQVGLVGFGLGGSVFHAPLVSTTPGLHLAAVVTRDAGRRREVERRYPRTRVVGDVASLWSLDPSLDLVVVSSPNATHVPLARAALEAGTHVVVDKPFAATAAEAREIGALAARRSRLAIPFQNRRWDGDFLTVQRLVRDEAFGTVYRYESRFERLRTTPKPSWCAAGAAARAEGVVYDIGSHLIDQAISLFGPVREVYAELDRRHPDVLVEDEAFVSLIHAGGVRSHLHMSAMAAQPVARMAVWGSSTAYVKHGLDGQERALKSGATPGPGWGVEPREHWGWLGAGDERRHAPTEPGSYPAFYVGVERAIRIGAPPPVLVAHAVASLAVIEAVFRSAPSRCAVAMPPNQMT
jgi:predicted dehydrogenase